MPIEKFAQTGCPTTPYGHSYGTGEHDLSDRSYRAPTKAFNTCRQ